jgi:hypothetical protein
MAIVMVVTIANRYESGLKTQSLTFLRQSISHSANETLELGPDLDLCDASVPGTDKDSFTPKGLTVDSTFNEQAPPRLNHLLSFFPMHYSILLTTMLSGANANRP